MKIAIAGGSGHLGQVLAHDLTEHGHEIVVLSRSGGRIPGGIWWDGRHLGPWTDAIDGADAVIRALNDSVLRTVEGAASIRSTGLSVYFPPTAATFDADYREVVGESPWLSLLDGYYGAGDAIPADSEPEFAAPDGGGDTAAIEVTPDGITISAQVNPDALGNLVRTVVSYGIVQDDGSITFLGEETQPFENDGSGTVSGTFDLTTFTMSDGEDTYTGYLWLDVDDEQGVITFDIPMAYYAPGDTEGETYQDALLSIAVDAASFDVLQETYYSYDDESETYGELYAEPEGIIVPEVYVQAADGTGTWEPTSDTGLYADLESLTYDFVRLPAGTRLYIDIAVVDYGGNSALASAQVEVP